MAYIKTNWTNREVTNPRTYTLQTNPDGTTTLIPAEGEIISEGTPITAENLNNMEDGIEDALPQAGGTITGALTVNGLLTAQKGGETLRIGAGPTADHAFISFFARTATPTVRSGFFGYPALGFTELELKNEIGDLKLTSGGTTLRTYFVDGNWLTFSPEKIQNHSGTGNMVIAAGEGGGYVKLHAPTHGVRCTTTELRVANVNYDGYVPVYASNYVNMSIRELKKNITPYDGNGEEIINSADVRYYQYKTELDEEIPHIGLIYDEAPIEVIDLKNNGIDIYAMCTIAWKAIQELSQKITALEAEVATLKGESTQ